MNVKQLLIAARAKIENPDNWCPGNIYEDSDGFSCWPHVDRAARMCAVGAIDSVGAGNKAHARALDIILAHGGVTTFSVPKSHAQVMAAFDAAIEEAHEQPL